MKKYISFVTACILTLLPIQKNILAETQTNIITASSPRELSAAVHKLIDNEKSFYIEENSEFPSNRIIVISETNFDYCGAEAVVNDSDGMYVLFYNTKSEAESAYTELVKNPYLDVMPDIELSIPISEDTEIADDDVSIYSSALGWGYDFIETEYFTDTLHSNYPSEKDMPEVVVAVIDTGVDYDHPYLAGRIKRGYDYIKNTSRPMDDNGHGTHIAGIICDNTTENVKVLAYKTIRADGNGSMSDTLAAMKDARSEGADIINLSLGSIDTYGYYYDEFYSAYNNIIKKGVTIVAAAGNEKSDTIYSFPASMDEVITVSACTRTGAFDSSYSNYGNSVDLCAPGTSIYSTVWDDSYGYKSGTSMACPHVSAAAALLKTADPSLTPEEIDYYLKKGAKDAGAKGFDKYYGYGLLNLKTLAKEFLAENQISTPKPTATPTPTPKPTSTPTPIPASELPMLVTASVSTDRYIKLAVTNDNNILKKGASVAVACYKNGTLTGLRTIEISSEYVKGFLLDDTIAFDTISVYVWNSIENSTPISKSYKIE